MPYTLRKMTLPHTLANQYAAFSSVETVALAGSRTSGNNDSSSDIDLYVYTREPLTLSQRSSIADNSMRREIDNSFWEPGDEWIDGQAGTAVDVMFRDPYWIEEQLQRVVIGHQASIGYSTCFWYNVLASVALFDRNAWFTELQNRFQVPYPAELRRAIIAKNYPLLRSNISSYLRQIEKALQRNDQVSGNHRTAALLASYFDILFAVNQQPHPGEKRLVQFAQQLCPKLPDNFAVQVQFITRLNPELIDLLHGLLDGLDDLLRREQLLPAASG